MPGISQQAKELNRAKILESASVMFREQGADQVGIDQLMRVAGLTRGGFYNHFDSKEALVAEACRKAFDEQCRDLASFLEEGPSSALHPLMQIAERYLATYHRDAPGVGCPAPTLGSEVARHGEQVQRSYADGVQAYLAMYVNLLAEDLSDRDSDAIAGSSEASAGVESGDASASSQRGRRAVAVEAFILMVGGMLISRAVGKADPDLSAEFLTIAQQAIGELPRKQLGN